MQSNKAFNPKGKAAGETDRAVEQGTLDRRTANQIRRTGVFRDGDRSRVVQYSPPHLTKAISQHRLVVTYTAAKSANFGRVQHRLGRQPLGDELPAPKNLALQPYADYVSAAGYSDLCR